MEKEWRVKDNFNNYRISNFGEIELISRGIKIKPKIDNNGFYRISMFSDDNKFVNFLVHRLVSELFMENKDNIKKIKHLDENKLNNELKNLAFIYPSKKSQFVSDLPNETWLSIPGYENYEVSNLGRIKSLFCGRCLKQTLDRCGYYKISLYDNGKSTTKSVHQLVVMAFLNHKPDGTLKLVVNHINYDKTNNNLDNLEIISARRNVMHSAYRKSHTDYSSIYVGVRRNISNSWFSTISYKKVDYYLGSYELESAAGEVYLKAVNAVENGSFDNFYLSIKDTFKDKFTSKYLGVTRNVSNSWVSTINYNKVSYYLGSYELESAASEIYLKAINAIENGSFDNFYLLLKNTFKDKFTSKYVGVSIHPISGKYISQITKDCKTYCLGRFDNEIDAHNEYVMAIEQINNNSFDEYISKIRHNINKTSKHKGISRDKKSGKWISNVTYNKKSYYIGSFDTEVEALKTYNDSLDAIVKNNFEYFIESIRKRNMISCEYDGVFYNNKKNNWVAILNKDDTKKTVGYYNSKDRAFKALNKRLVCQVNL